MILSNFCKTLIIVIVYQQRQQRRLAIMTSERSKWNNSLGEFRLSIIIHWQISVNYCRKCNKCIYLATHLITSHGILSRVLVGIREFPLIWTVRTVDYLSVPFPKIVKTKTNFFFILSNYVLREDGEPLGKCCLDSYLQIRYMYFCYPKIIVIFLITVWKHMLWVIIRSTSPMHF